MPYRALLFTILSVALALLAVATWVHEVAPMLAESNASTQPSSPPTASHPAISEKEASSTRPVPAYKQFNRVVKGTMILAFILICMLFVVGFFAMFRSWVRYSLTVADRRAKKTQYVDAWKLAGERMDHVPPPDDTPDSHDAGSTGGPPLG
ncbi:MAG TPA: hypothetical protein VGN88_13615 [Phycisphaerae bacterium]|jgi:hypothetical protein